ncbi:MAG TPA: SCO family protein, partial [Methylomirabilota bacterium]|nr:SCO family protein [Methylomirabilota bacterium]
MRLARAALLAWLAGAAPALAREAGGVPPLEFEPPAPGTYALHRIMAAPEGEVLDLDGRAQPLGRFTRGRITVLGFVYTTCVDPDGCPLTLRVFDEVKRALDATPALRERVRLVMLSFDPERDRPAAMRGYAGRRAGAGGVPWHFLTTRSPRAIRPIVDGFGQDVRSSVRLTDGGKARELSHVLKVFLLDPD